MKETWKPIAGFEGLYEVSNKGNVKALLRLVVTKGKNPYCLSEKLLRTPGKKYARVGLTKKKKRFYFSVHRLVGAAFLDLNIDDKYQYIDHIDRDTHNNSVENLRICTNSQNQMNRGKSRSNKSGYKGVFRLRNKWIAQICLNNKYTYLGSFDDPIDAAEEYQKVAKKIHQEFYAGN